MNTITSGSSGPIRAPRPRRAIGVLLAALSFGLLVATGTGCANDKQVIGQANQTHTSLQPAVMQDPELANYLQSVGDRIIGAAKQLDAEGYGPKSHKKEEDSWMYSNEMKFHLVNSKTLNAFTTGGEHMYIYNELFEQCKSEPELAAVMAHEYGHVYARHVQTGMNRQLAVMLGSSAVGAAGYVAGGSESGQQYATTGAGLAASAGQFATMGFTRKDEAQADELGFTFYTRAGYDPKLFANFFKTMIQKGLDKTPAYMSDHPTLASRVEVADKRAGEVAQKGKAVQKPPIADDAQFRHLQQRAAQVAQSTPDDKSLQNSKQLLQALPRSCLTPDEPAPADARAAQQALVERGEQEHKAAQKAAPK